MADSSSSDDSEIEESIERDFEAEPKDITDDLLPAKSCARYNQWYDELKRWCDVNKANSYSEDVLLNYFKELSQTFKPSTLWSRWSMLRSVINLKHNININQYERLKTLIKNKAKGFHSKQSLVLKWNEIEKFLDEAANCMYLAMKVILIIGISGALRSGEFCNINCSDVEDTGSQYIITIKDTKNYYPRNFVISGQFYQKVHEYAALRPSDLATDRFFIQYLNGKCIRQVIGKNKISEVPKIIAKYLNLPEPERYTGHCFRRTAATLLSNSGASLQTLKELGGWRSNAVAERYIEKSIGNKQKIFEQLVSAGNIPNVRNMSILPVRIPSSNEETVTNVNTDIQNDHAQKNFTDIPNDLIQEFESDFTPNNSYANTSSDVKIPVSSTVTSNDFSVPSTSTAQLNFKQLDQNNLKMPPKNSYTNTSSHVKIPTNSTTTSNNFSVPSTSTAQLNLNSQQIDQNNLKMPLKSITNFQFSKPYARMACDERKKANEKNKRENDLNPLTDPTKLTMKHCRIKNLVINYNYCSCDSSNVNGS